MKATIRRGTPFFLLGLLLVLGAPAAAGGAEHSEDGFDCTGPSSAEQAHKTPPNTEDGDHPSGKPGKGLEEPGRSGTQGRSDSDPDGQTNGGADKPGCEGGFDLHDQDGNNGCGNDHDFEEAPICSSPVPPAQPPSMTAGIKGMARCPRRSKARLGHPGPPWPH